MITVNFYTCGPHTNSYQTGPNCYKDKYYQSSMTEDGITKVKSWTLLFTLLWITNCDDKAWPYVLVITTGHEWFDQTNNMDSLIFVQLSLSLRFGKRWLILENSSYENSLKEYGYFHDERQSLRRNVLVIFITWIVLKTQKNESTLIYCVDIFEC